MTEMFSEEINNFHLKADTLLGTSNRSVCSEYIVKTKLVNIAKELSSDKNRLETLIMRTRRKRYRRANELVFDLEEKLDRMDADALMEIDLDKPTPEMDKTIADIVKKIYRHDV